MDKVGATRAATRGSGGQAKPEMLGADRLSGARPELRATTPQPLASAEHGIDGVVLRGLQNAVAGSIVISVMNIGLHRDRRRHAQR